MATSDGKAPSADSPDTAWSTYLEAARTMCELAGVGLGVVHLGEVPMRVEWVQGVGLRASSGDVPLEGGVSHDAAEVIIQAAARGGEPNDVETWRVVGWDERRALAIGTDAGRGATIAAWAAREAARFRDLGRAEAALDALGEGIVIVDAARRVTCCTGRAAELLGAHEGAAIEARLAREVMPFAVDRLEPNEVARGVVSPDQAVTYVAQHMAPSSAEGTPRAGIVLRLRSDQRFHATRRGQLQLLSALRHDVRSPLTALRGLVGVLQEEPDMPREERMALLELLRQEAERTVTWVEDYLILLRLRFEPRPLNPVPLAPESLLRALEAQYVGHARGRGVAFTIDLPPASDDARPLVIEADPALVDAFCKNLVGHFLRLADSGAEVRAAIEADGALVVEGHGPGLFAHHPENPFTTLARSTAAGKRTPGVGLGLYLAKKVADVHGWPIAIESGDGRVRAQVRWATTSEDARARAVRNAEPAGRFA